MINSPEAVECLATPPCAGEEEYLRSLSFTGPFAQQAPIALKITADAGAWGIFFENSTNRTRGVELVSWSQRRSDSDNARYVLGVEWLDGPTLNHS